MLVKSSKQEQLYHWQTANLSAAETCTVKSVLKSTEDLQEECSSSQFQYWAATEITGSIWNHGPWLHVSCACNYLYKTSFSLASPSAAVCLLNPCPNGDSKSQKHEEECYFYLLPWKFCVSFSMAGLDTCLRHHSSWPQQHNLRCWSFNAWIPWRGDGVTVCNIAQETTQCSSTTFEKLLHEGSPFFIFHVSPHVDVALRDTF